MWLTKHIDAFGMDEQCSSLLWKGCAHATFTLKLSLQTLWEHQQEAWVLVVDLVKACDSVNYKPLWKTLNLYGVPDNLINILKKNRF